MLRLVLMVLMIFGSTNSNFAQSCGLQIYQGINLPIVTYKGDKTLKYNSNLTSDFRLGVKFGNTKKLNYSALLGYINTNSIHVNEVIATSFTISNLILDFPIRYSIEKSFLNSVAIGPSFGALLASSQTNNGLLVNTDGVFKKANISVLVELSFLGYEKSYFSIEPYLNYRRMLTTIDADGDRLFVNGVSFGLRADISKTK